MISEFLRLLDVAPRPPPSPSQGCNVSQDSGAEGRNECGVGCGGLGRFRTFRSESAEEETSHRVRWRDGVILTANGDKAPSLRCWNFKKAFRFHTSCFRILSLIHFFSLGTSPTIRIHAAITSFDTQVFLR